MRWCEAAAQAEEMEDGPLRLRRKRALGLCGSGRWALQWVMGGVKVSIGQTLGRPGCGPDPFFLEVFAFTKTERSDGFKTWVGLVHKTHPDALFNSPHCVL